MNRFIKSQGSHVIQRNDFVNHVANSYTGWHVCAPVLLVMTGLVIPVAIFTAVLVPSAIPLMTLIMTALMLTAASLMFFSLIATGEAIEVRFDKVDSAATLLYRGFAANTRWTIPLDQFVGARMAMSYDEKGAKVTTPVLELRKGGSVILPKGTTWNDIEALRIIIESQHDKTGEAWARKAEAIKSGYVRRH